MKVPYLLIHVTHWSCDHVILKKDLSPPALAQWPLNLAKCDLSWVDHKHRVRCLIYRLTTLYSKEGVSPVSQRQWSFNLVGLWVRVKGSHQFYQVIRRSSHHVFFDKRHVSNNARPQNSTGGIKHRKNCKPKAFFVIQKILTFDSHRYTQL